MKTTKQKLQNISILRKVYRKIRKILIYILSYLSYKTLVKMLYFEVYGRFPNLKSPTTFSEKLAWLRLYEYNHNLEVRKLVDKVEVRNYVSRKGYSKILVDSIGVWNSVEEIEWDKLPNQFVLKCNHGSGFNLICRDKESFDMQKAKKTLNKWMNKKYWLKSGETFYRGIKKKIIGEVYMPEFESNDMKDIKVFCSNGIPRFLYVAQDRTTHNTKFDFFTTNWEWLPVKNHYPNSDSVISKPLLLNEIFNIAKDLSDDWSQIRVDFYYNDKSIYFSELTFLTFSGRPFFEPEEFDEYFGRQIIINKNRRKKKRQNDIN